MVRFSTVMTDRLKLIKIHTRRRLHFLQHVPFDRTIISGLSKYTRESRNFALSLKYGRIKSDLAKAACNNPCTRRPLSWAAWETDRQTDCLTYFQTDTPIIGNNSLHSMHPKNAAMNSNATVTWIASGILRRFVEFGWCFGRRRIQRYVFARGGNIDLADYVADRSTDVRFRAPLCTATARRRVACGEAYWWKTQTKVSAFAQLSAVCTYRHRRASSTVDTWFYNTFRDLNYSLVAK